MFIFKRNLKTAVNVALLPVSQNLRIFWNFGSLLGLFIVIQIASGILLATWFFLGPDAFYLIRSRNTPNQLSRYIHANGASILFIFLYCHIGRGIYYISYRKIHTWRAGTTIFILIIATAFIGYVLPANQISFWGASVITRLLREIPAYGSWLINILWGDWRVDIPLYTRFFGLHYILPFIIVILIFIHILFLHTKGSRRPLGTHLNPLKKNFFLYFTISDFWLIFTLLLITIYLNIRDFDVWDHDVFAKSSTLITPVHIQPEWYFLYAYAILRAVPRKLGGVIALLLAVLVLYTLPYTIINKKNRIKAYSPNLSFFWLFIITILLLTWIGKRPAEEPYISISRWFIFIYFIYFFLNQIIIYFLDMLFET